MDKKENFKAILKILMVVSAFFVVVYLISSFSAYFFGLTFIFNTMYGFEAVQAGLVLYAYAYWFILGPSALILIGGGIYFLVEKRKEKKRNDNSVNGKND